MFAEIVFPIPVNQTYLYSVPDELKENFKIGTRVKVDFNNRVTVGYVVNLKNRIEDENIISKIKPVISIIDPAPIFTSQMYKLARWISDYYITSLGEALKIMIPSAVKEREPEIPEYNYGKRKEITLNTAQKEIFEQILKMELPSYTLIHGVTGSGKTEIYFKLIEHFIKKKSRLYILFQRYH